MLASVASVLAVAAPQRATASPPEAVVLVRDVCDGSERDPKAGIPVPPELDICTLSIRGEPGTVTFELAMRRLATKPTENLASYQVLWKSSSGCSQGWWRRTQAGAVGSVVEWFQKCPHDTSYRFLPGVAAVQEGPGAVRVTIASRLFTEKTMLREPQVFTEAALFSARNPVDEQGRAHGAIGVADEAGPGRPYRL